MTTDDRVNDAMKPVPLSGAAAAAVSRKADALLAETSASLDRAERADQEA
jgi:hypothetical protein